MASFGERLKELREQAGLTQEQLAEKAGLHRVALARLEAGMRTEPTWSTVKAICRALGVSCEEFQADEPAPPTGKKTRGKGKP